MGWPGVRGICISHRSTGGSLCFLHTQSNDENDILQMEGRIIIRLISKKDSRNGDIEQATFETSGWNRMLLDA